MGNNPFQFQLFLSSGAGSLVPKIKLFSYFFSRHKLG